jgi:putative membrane protein
VAAGSRFRAVKDGKRQAMKRLAYLTGLAGLLGLTVLIAHQGVDDLVRVLAQGGWPLLLVVPFHALPLVLDAQGWRTLLPAGPERRVGRAFLSWVASVREAVNRLLPTFNVGGELVGLRLARLRLPDTTAIAASIVVEVMLTLFSQYLFALAGVLMLPAAMQSGGPGWAILAGLLLSLPLPILFALLLRHQAVFERLERVALRLFGTAAALNGAQLDACIHALLARRTVLLKALGWQLAGLLAGTWEVWFALRMLGHPVGFGEALAIEALTQAARHIAFFVPAGLGVQEAVVLLLGEALGVSPQISLSLALVKRARELLFGIPALLSWQWLEWRQRRAL